MEKNLTITVTSASGIEAVTKRELFGLGIQDAPAIDGKITFLGSALDVARCNMFLRTADRVYIQLGQFPATTFDELFIGITQIDWQNFVSSDGEIYVNARSTGSILYSLSSIQSISKKAIIETLKDAYQVSDMPESGSQFKVMIAIYNDVVTISLDTSGDGLHKRGYRDFVGEAPIKETMAAAMILLSVWKWDRPLVDLFCGSGTIPIEAAMIGIDMAPGYNRGFSYEMWDNFPKDVIDIVRQEAKDRIKPERELRIFGYDIDREAIKLCNRHALAAGVSGYIHFQCSDMRDFRSRYSYGVIITNPPYGERLLDEKEVSVLYKALGKLYVTLDKWSLYAITSASCFEYDFGMRAYKTRKLYNAKLKCRLYQYLGPAPRGNINANIEEENNTTTNIEEENNFTTTIEEGVATENGRE